MHVYKYANISVFNCASIQVIKYASVPVCYFKVYKYASMKNASIWVWNYYSSMYVLLGI